MISSEAFAAQRAANALTLPPALLAPPAPLAPLAPPAPSATSAPPVPWPPTVPEHQPELPTAQPCWMDWFATHAPKKNGPLLHEEVSAGSDHGSHRSHRIQKFFDEREWELQSVRLRFQELESMIKRQGSRTSFESGVSNDAQTPPGLPAPTLHPRPISIADPLHECYATSVQDPFELPHVSDTPSPPPPTPLHGDNEGVSSSSDESEVQRKKKKRGIYKVTNADVPLPQYPNALPFQSWRRAVRTAAISSCEKPERARAFIFSVESEDASFDSLSVSDSDKHRALDAKLADALLKIVEGDLARRLAVMSETLAKRGLVLARRQILFLVYRSCVRKRCARDKRAIILSPRTCRIQNPDIPWAGRVGALGGAAGRGRARLGANRIIRPGNKSPPYPPRHRRNVASMSLQKHEQAKSHVNRRRNKISG